MASSSQMQSSPSVDDCSSSMSVRNPNSPKKVVHCRVTEVKNTLIDTEFPSLGVRDGEGYSIRLPLDGESVATVRPRKSLPHVPHFFFFYRDVFVQLGVRFPLSEFQICLLNHLQLAPTQLHPNGWAFALAFENLCREMDICCTVPVFMTFYSPLELGGFRSPSTTFFGWTSLRGRSEHMLFKPFCESWKNFKKAFVKVEAHPFKCPWFLRPDKCGELEGVFPLYWTNTHHKFKTADFAPSRLTETEEASVVKLTELSSTLKSLMDPADHIPTVLVRRRGQKRRPMGKPEFLEAFDEGTAAETAINPAKALAPSLADEPTVSGGAPIPEGAGIVKKLRKRSAPKGGPKHDEKRRRVPKSKNVVGEETIVIPAPPSPVREVPTSIPAEASPIRETPTTGPVPTSSTNSVPSSFSIPHSHDTMNGGALWSEGVNGAIRDLMRPPAQLYSPSMPSNEEKLQWIEMERQAYKAASLIRPYAALRIQNALRLRSVNDLKQQISTLNSSLELERKEKNELLSENHNLKSNADLPKVTAERDQAQQELEITRAEKEKARKDLAALNKRFVTAVEHIAIAETNLSFSQNNLANTQAELKLAQLGLDAKQTELAHAQAEVLRLSNICREDMLLKEKMISDNEHLAGVLKEKDDELATARMKIAKYSQIGRLSFENAVAQIRVLNPTVNLNTAGLHLQAYVSGKGKLIPPGGEDSDAESSSPTHSRV